MAEEGTLCINADVLKKAGAQASSVSSAESYTNVYIKMAEGQLCAAARIDFVTNYADVSDIGKEILRDACSCAAALDVMDYDRTGYFQSEASDKSNVLWARFQKIIALLEKDDKYKDFIMTGDSTYG